MEYFKFLEVFFIDNREISEIYYHVTGREMKISKGRYLAPTNSSDEILGITSQIKEIAKSDTVPRFIAQRMGQKDITYESIAAHTNLMSAIVDRVLSYKYGPYFDTTEDGYTYREIMEVIRRHDLPENEIGDSPDNGSIDEAKKASTENLYWKFFANESPKSESNFEKRVLSLQNDMAKKKGFTGQILHAADKASAVIAALAYDEQGYPPLLDSCQPDLSDRDLYQMQTCRQNTVPGRPTSYKASELWSVDYFKGREIFQYDQTGLVTAILIMSIITTNGKWYEWREKDYENYGG